MYFQDGGATWRPTLEPLTRMYFQWHIIHTRILYYLKEVNIH